MIISKWPDPPDDLLQVGVPPDDHWQVADPPDDHLQDAGSSG